MTDLSGLIGKFLRVEFKPLRKAAQNAGVSGYVIEILGAFLNSSANPVQVVGRVIENFGADTGLHGTIGAPSVGPLFGPDLVDYSVQTKILTK